MLNNGIVAINKPVGMTSHDVVNRVRRITGERRVGHAGTLDPLASGVLILLIGKGATTQQSTFMDLNKSYEAEVTFGSTSATDDAQGPITPVATLEQLQAISQDQVEKIIPQFVGDIMQTPPAFSALKIGGKAAYKRAREGTLTQDMLVPRLIHIDAIELISFVPAIPPFPATARIRVLCHKGTYIRALARDMGASLGVGAYMSGLCRTSIGDFTLEKSLSIESFELEWKKQTTQVAGV